jgi:crossover junction endodeoxyribonuclease RuvC
MRILGIDPGIAITGWSIIDFDNDGKPNPIDYGAIFTEKGLTVSERLGELYTDIKEILSKYTPEVCGIETLLFAKNAKTGIVVGEARGVILLAVEQSLLPVYEFTPLQVKSSISGYGRADKKQVQRNVQLICDLDEIPKPDDVADAIAVAIACFDRLRMENIK